MCIYFCLAKIFTLNIPVAKTGVHGHGRNVRGQNARQPNIIEYLIAGIK